MEMKYIILRNEVSSENPHFIITILSLTVKGCLDISHCYLKTKKFKVILYIKTCLKFNLFVIQETKTEHKSVCRLNPTVE